MSQHTLAGDRPTQPSAVALIAIAVGSAAILAGAVAATVALTRNARWHGQSV